MYIDTVHIPNNKKNYISTLEFYPGDGDRVTVDVFPVQRYMHPDRRPFSVVFGYGTELDVVCPPPQVPCYQCGVKYPHTLTYFSPGEQWTVTEVCRVCHRKRSNQQSKKRRDSNVIHRLINNHRSRIHHAFRAAALKKTHRSIEYLGCTIPEYKAHLEAQFQSEQSWENYGKTWEIDHIIPLCSAKSEEELMTLFHYTNTRPLWSSENRSKGGR